jgi:hypothetical protein
MGSDLSEAVRIYLRRGGTTNISSNTFYVIAYIVASRYLPLLASSSNAAVTLGPALRDPFTILAVAIFFLSFSILDFMAFRIKSIGLLEYQRVDPVFRQREIYRSYREAFGNDLISRLWRYRIVFVLLFAIAGVRWLSTLKAP